MRIITVLYFLLNVVIRSYAQDVEPDDILLASKKRDGVYRSFREFRSNSPSITGQLKITANRVKVLDERSGKYENVNEDFWGACRNDTIYVYLEETATAQSPHIQLFCISLNSGASNGPRNSVVRERRSDL